MILRQESVMCYVLHPLTFRIYHLTKLMQKPIDSFVNFSVVFQFPLLKGSRPHAGTVGPSVSRALLVSSTDCRKLWLRRGEGVSQVCGEGCLYVIGNADDKEVEAK